MILRRNLHIVKSITKGATGKWLIKVKLLQTMKDTKKLQLKIHHLWIQHRLSTHLIFKWVKKTIVSLKPISLMLRQGHNYQLRSSLHSREKYLVAIIAASKISNHLILVNQSLIIILLTSSKITKVCLILLHRLKWIQDMKLNTKTQGGLLVLAVHIKNRCMVLEAQMLDSLVKKLRMKGSKRQFLF